MIYFTSDTHFCHDKPFLYEPRGFKSIEEHDETIIKNWNSIIEADDDVYILGDVMLMNDNKGLYYLKQLKGNIHIIRGNHCTDNRVELYKTLPNIVEITYATVIKYGKQSFYLSHYPTITTPADSTRHFSQNLICLYGHTHQKEHFYNNNPYCYHVGVDSENCTPIDIELILERCRKQKNDIDNGKILL